MRIGRRTSTLGAALLAGVLVLAACGGDDSGSSAGTTAAASAETTTASGSGSAETTASGGAGTTAAGDSSATTVDTNFSGEGSEAFCSKLKEFEDSPVLNGDPNFDDPAKVKEQYTAIEDAINQLADVAPAEIQDNVKTMKSSLAELITLLKEYDYDFTKLSEAAQKDPKIAERFQNAGTSDEVAAASDRLSAYGEQVCGITDTTTGG